MSRLPLYRAFLALILCWLVFDRYGYQHGEKYSLTHDQAMALSWDAALDQYDPYSFIRPNVEPLRWEEGGELKGELTLYVNGVPTYFVVRRP